MKIEIAENIRRMRNEKDLTQEQLAEQIGVSAQSVSRWETDASYPDIQMLPVIAAFFNVSVDRLMGIDTSDIKRQIDEVMRESNRLQSEGKNSECIKLLREKIKEYPNSADLLEQLAGCLYTSFKADYNEIIELCERACRLAEDMQTRFGCKQIMALSYKELGQTDKALEVIADFPHIACTQETILPLVAEEGDAHKQHQHNLLGFAENIHRVFYDMSHWAGNTLQKIELLKKSVDVFNIVLGDNKGFFSERISVSYLRMARLYCEAEDIENALEALENSEKYAVMYETRPEGGKYGVYWLELIEDIRRLQTAKNTEKNQYEAILEALEGKDFSIIREDNRFKGICGRLNKHNAELKKQTDNI